MSRLSTARLPVGMIRGRRPKFRTNELTVRACRLSSHFLHFTLFKSRISADAVGAVHAKKHPRLLDRVSLILRTKRILAAAMKIGDGVLYHGCALMPSGWPKAGYRFFDIG